IDAEVVQRTGELQASEARIRAMLEASLDCIVTIDHSGKVIEFNSAAEHTFGYARHAALGKSVAELIIPSELRDSHPLNVNEITQAEQGKLLGKRIEVDVVGAEGTLIPVELAVLPIRQQASPMYTAYLRDITERRRTEKALRENEENLRQKQKLEAV